MHISPDDSLLSILHVDHPVYRVRLWDEPADTPGGWNSRPVRITDAIDIDEVIEWARSESPWYEVFAEAFDESGREILICVTGYNAAVGYGASPEQFVSNPANLKGWRSALARAEHA